MNRRNFFRFLATAPVAVPAMAAAQVHSGLKDGAFDATRGGFKRAAEIYRDFESPSCSHRHLPSKSDIRDWCATIERAVGLTDPVPEKAKKER